MNFDEIILTEEELSALKELIDLTKDGGMVYVEDENRKIMERFESLGFAEIYDVPKFSPHMPRESSRRFSAPRSAKVTEKGFRYLLYLAEQEKEKAERQAKEAEEKADQLSQSKRDRRFSLLNTLLGAAAGALLTLFTDHFNEIRLFFQCLLQRR